MTDLQPLPTVLAVFPMRDQVMFPHMVMPLYIDAARIGVIETALRDNNLLVLATSFSQTEPPAFDDLAKIATICRISQVIRSPEGGCKVTAEGLRRVYLSSCVAQQPQMLARIRLVEEEETGGLVTETLVQSVNALLKIALAAGRPLPGDVMKMIDQIGDAGRLADLVTVYLNLDIASQQRLLEILDPLDRLKEVYLRLTTEVQRLQVRGDIQTEVTRNLSKTQKEYFLREQMKQIRKELGDQDPRQDDLDNLRQKIDPRKMPPEVHATARREFKRLENINPSSPEYTVARTYLEFLCDMPWKHASHDNLDLDHAETVLNRDHHDLKDVKERILEYLAVRSLKSDSRGAILCFVGPPGVGKTSLGRSIARAMERKFIRLSLGGLKDEAEIRGHRRTYIGALPGRIIQEIRRAGVNNPVFMLDEIDKIGQDFRGDPASALLEVLDPEQNNSFNDHYLDVPFDLSRVMFITTANIMDPVPSPLRDRMEVINLAGYSYEEKLQIAVDYLVPKQKEENGLAEQPLTFTRQALLQIIKDYTREAGVRGLERKIAAICRKLAHDLARKKKTMDRIDSEQVRRLLGARSYFTDVAGEEDRVGVVTGLAWTEHGGDIIFVEAAIMKGEKGFTLTGNLGEVMQESAQTALSFVREHAARFSIEEDFFSCHDLHIHVPAGAIPKDGPSAGVTMAAALISLLTGRAARRDVAMTGELTLSGRILPVGGVKEKLLAARRAGVRTVLFPARNAEQLAELEPGDTEGVRVSLIESMFDVTREALCGTGRPCSGDQPPTATPPPG
ncbi:endopeptidase La [Geothermobacter hydrogeniphilus]|uniref:Lon protease n=1 Tax=Geothermobacter hydrogeniphilus TaxID=1969733 RepID=A0A1X0YC98_9BACT|nr:endopeptidase La [Geothermobacter hydrogeniphilus]ORJ62850.1 endopeptidase La [Geothermobacter hydrogeniphilus]